MTDAVERALEFADRYERLGRMMSLPPGVEETVALALAYRAASARIAALEAERDKPWNDREDEWSAAIQTAHPTKTQRFDLDDKARQMVSARHSKGALVALVNWLLAQLATVTAERDAAREEIRRLKERDEARADDEALR
jgi:hypothetical protein